MSNLAQTIAEQNQRLIQSNSIYRYELTNDGLIDLVDIKGQPVYDEPEMRYINLDELVDYTTELMSDELSCQ